MKNNIPKVGLAVIIGNKNNNVLIGKRKGAHGEGTLGFPGGKLDYFESFVHCGEREVYEETGLKVKIIDKYPIAVTEDFFERNNKHYVTIFIRARHLSGEPRVIEPDKCEYWKYVSWNDLVLEKEGPLFLPVKNLIKQNYNPFGK